jgi:hypothetical protein
MGQKRGRDDLTRGLVVTGLVGTVVGIAAYVRRRAQLAPGGPGGTGGATQPASATGEAHREWHCECGQELRVTGEGRHRVFWLVDAGPEDPLLEGRCPSCERILVLQP